MGTTPNTQPVLTPAIPSTYLATYHEGVCVASVPISEFEAIKLAAMDAMITLQLLAEGRITIEGSANAIERDIAALRSIWKIDYTYR